MVDSFRSESTHLCMKRYEYVIALLHYQPQCPLQALVIAITVQAPPTPLVWSHGWSPRPDIAMQLVDPPNHGDPILNEICNLARLNRAFRGAALSDSVWEAKLPVNYQDLLDLLPLERYKSLSKKDIFALISIQKKTRCIWFQSYWLVFCFLRWSSG